MLITPKEIKIKALRIWNSGKIPSLLIQEEEFLPICIPFKKPPRKILLHSFDEAKSALKKLHNGSKENKGYGYQVEYNLIEHRTLGRQKIPHKILFEQKNDYLRFIGKEKDFSTLVSLKKLTLEKLPELITWLDKHPLQALNYQHVWGKLLKICLYFLKKPLPNVHLRELDIEGVDTKFIESHKSILRTLLDVVLPEQFINKEFSKLSGSGFARRYGLLYDEARVRFKFLDREKTSLYHFNDLSVPISEFAKCSVPISKVFIVENVTVGLSFPSLIDSIVIFGMGYQVKDLSKVSWLKDKEIYYWGDIDTHGFAILSMLRNNFPDVKSLLMDEKTLLEFKNLWSKESETRRSLNPLKHLTEEENNLFSALCANRYAENVRLEQEKISYKYVAESIAITKSPFVYI